MKKKITGLLALLLCFCFMVCACGDGKKDVITTNPISYNYEQELNVIEDNYRNYYEIFVGSFYDSDGDGMGDLKGVTAKLDYIKDLGFNGIWLMPIMESPSYHKYDIVDYCSIDTDYGTMEDFEELVEECHKRDIRIIIDFVMNHTSSSHPWFKEACQYVEGLGADEEIDPEACPYADYYHFTRKRVNETYYKVGNSDWYYEGNFWSEMPDLNYSNEDLKKAFEEIADFWIAKGIDGFRMDAVMHFEENQTEFNNEVLNWIYNYCKAQNPDFYMVSEVWANQKTITDYYASGTPSFFNFAAAQAEGVLVKTARGTSKASTLVSEMVKYQEDYSAKNPDYIDAPFLTNHDNVRVANALNADAKNVKLAAGLLLMMNGSPFVYYGEEIGATSTGQKDEDKRLPMEWSATDTTGLTKGPSGADAGTTNNFGTVEEQLTDGASVLNYYKRALRLRNENPEIARGQIEIIASLTDDKIAAITKTYEDSTLGIVYNLDGEERQIDLSGTELETMEIRGYLTLNGEEVTLKDQVANMPAYSILLLK